MRAARQTFQKFLSAEILCLDEIGSPLRRTFCVGKIGSRPRGHLCVGKIRSGRGRGIRDETRATHAGKVSPAEKGGAPRISGDRDLADIAQPAKKLSGWHWHLLALPKRVLKPQDKNLLGKKFKKRGRRNECFKHRICTECSKESPRAASNPRVGNEEKAHLI